MLKIKPRYSYTRIVLSQYGNGAHFSRNMSNGGKKSTDGCDDERPQNLGKVVKDWPSADHQASTWRCGCPCGPQPVNYDPYKIKLPDLAVPPLPPTSVKPILLSKETSSAEEPEAPGYGQQEGYAQQASYQPPAAAPARDEAPPEEAGETGFMAALKKLYRDFRGNMPSIECAKCLAPCSGKGGAVTPPCPPPPKKPFPWIYVWPWVLFLFLTGVMYKVYLYKLYLDEMNAVQSAWAPRKKVKNPNYEADLPQCVQYLIVGGGAAGFTAYKSIMKRDRKAKVFIITKEDTHPYIRLPMSNYMWFNRLPPDIATLNYISPQLHKQFTMYLQKCTDYWNAFSWKVKNRGPSVGLATGYCVLRVDAEHHVAWVKTKCGEQPIYYERCLLAPGSSPKCHPAFAAAPKELRAKVCHLRTIRDLELAYRRVESARHVTVLGGGLLGSELAYYVSRRNKVIVRDILDEYEPPEVVQVIKGRGVLSSLLPEYLGEWAAEKIKEQGTTIIPNAMVYDAFMTPEGRVQLTLSNGTSLVTDFVLAAVGAAPREDLAITSHLERDPTLGGFSVNPELMSRTHLYVAGDAASFFSEDKGYRLRCEHHLNAVDQGEIAGANMTGERIPCNIEPYFIFKLEDDVTAEVIGEVESCLATVGVFKPCSGRDLLGLEPQQPADPETPCYKKTEGYKWQYKRGLVFYLRDNVIVGIVGWNLAPTEDRRAVMTEILRARPGPKDIALIAELLEFGAVECADPAPVAEEAKKPVCFERMQDY